MNRRIGAFKQLLRIGLNTRERKDNSPSKKGGMRFMCKACELAKVVTNECNDRGFDISAAKLQKLLVIMHGKHLAMYDKPMFPENVLCWKCGVAIKEIDRKFLLYDFSKKDNIPQQIAILQSEEHVIMETLRHYGSIDVVELNRDRRLIELTTRYPYIEGEKTIIPNDAIKKVFMDYEETL